MRQSRQWAALPWHRLQLHSMRMTGPNGTDTHSRKPCPVERKAAQKMARRGSNRSKRAGPVKMPCDVLSHGSGGQLLISRAGTSGHRTRRLSRLAAMLRRVHLGCCRHRHGVLHAQQMLRGCAPVPQRHFLTAGSANACAQLRAGHQIAHLAGCLLHIACMAQGQAGHVLASDPAQLPAAGMHCWEAHARHLVGTGTPFRRAWPKCQGCRPP